jgi:protocatechuate 3,4-dioxygenase beta subunit
MGDSRTGMSRRQLLHASATLPALALVPRLFAAPEPTPDCGDEPTPAQTAGPFYTPESPRRASLREPGLDGEPLRVSGQVLDRDCQPLAGAILDFWQADAKGRYDNRGFRLRGHLLTDPQGRYALDTIVPGRYPGRTSHLHVRVLTAAGRRLLTTQLYFPDDPGNARDFLFNPLLLMALARDAEGAYGGFDFIVRTR